MKRNNDIVIKHDDTSNWQITFALVSLFIIFVHVFPTVSAREAEQISTANIFAHTTRAGFDAFGVNSCVKYNDAAGTCIYFQPPPFSCFEIDRLREMWSPDLVVDVTPEPYQTNIAEMTTFVEALVAPSKPIQDRGVDTGSNPVTGGIGGPIGSTLAAQFNAARVFAHPASITWHDIWNQFPNNIRFTCSSQANAFLGPGVNAFAYASEMDREWRSYTADFTITDLLGERIKDDKGNDWGAMLPLTGFSRAGTTWYSTLSKVIQSAYLATSKPFTGRGLHTVMDIFGPGPVLGGLGTRRCGGVDCVGPKPVMAQKKSDDGYFGLYLHHAPLPGGGDSFNDVECRTMPTADYNQGDISDTKTVGQAVGTFFRHYSCCPPKNCAHVATIPSIKR